MYPADALPAMKRRAEAKKYSFPYLFDETQEVARSFGAVRTPEPMPESSARTWWTAVRVIGTNTRPMPTAIRTMNGKMCAQ